MTFFQSLRDLWRDSDKLVRVFIVATFPIFVIAAWLAYVFDTDI